MLQKAIEHINSSFYKLENNENITINEPVYKQNKNLAMAIDISINLESDSDDEKPI